jgi:hypothetical protein
MAYTRLAVCLKATFHHIGELGVFFSVRPRRVALDCALADVFFSVVTLYLSRPEPYPNSVIIKFPFD